MPTMAKTCRFGMVHTRVGKIWLASSHHYASHQSLVPFHFSFYVNSLTNGRVLG